MISWLELKAKVRVMVVGWDGSNGDKTSLEIDFIDNNINNGAVVSGRFIVPFLFSRTVPPRL
jgi:hypothetical protein